MQYTLLTGATGLLGNYLVRDLLHAGVPIAVVVRSNRKQTARQRMEVLLSHWDAHSDAPLPRPVVLEGDISQEDLGLDANDMRWAAESCGAVIHNAASLSFHATSADGEPYRSNIVGTQNVLDFARANGIRKFHHVSTAYVAGLRHGRVMETDVDVGQELGNDYEKSKLAAEKLVRNADFLDRPTVGRGSSLATRRPGIPRRITASTPRCSSPTRWRKTCRPMKRVCGAGTRCGCRSTAMRPSISCRWTGSLR
jgi:thioester reductase-like protein